MLPVPRRLRRLACLLPLALTAAQPAPPSPVIVLDQGWSAAESDRYHATPQGTLLLPLAWMQAMHTGALPGSPTLLDPTLLAQLRFLTDDVPATALNPHALPIGWTVAVFPSPDGSLPAEEKVGFSCAACHTGQINYQGHAIRIEGAGALHDAAQYQSILALAVITTAKLPWKRARFLDEVSRSTGQDRAVIARALDGADAKAIRAAEYQLLHPLYATEGFGRLDALQRIANTLLADDLNRPDNNRRGEGPVKYPYLWDIWRLDWVQYNASVRQPMVRNAGEALGVRAETNFSAPPPARWDSSVMIPNLQWMEQALRHLHAPAWPADLLGARDDARYAAGRALFAKDCAGCHGIHATAAGEWQVTQVPLAHIGTDPNEARAFIDHRYDASALGLGAAIDGATALRVVTEAIKDHAYDQLGWTEAEREAADGNRPNEVNANPVYKARPLIGIWASPPYLHNGAVPSLYDLLSPDRPARFPVGTRDYDPIHVGYSTAPFEGAQWLDTSQPGNSNAGHWFTDDAARPGRIGPGLSEADRLAIVEYLKFVTYKDYPCTDAATGATLQGAACGS